MADSNVLVKQVNWPTTDPIPDIVKAIENGTKDIIMNACHEYIYWWLWLSGNYDKAIEFEKVLIENNATIHLILGCTIPPEHVNKYPLTNMVVYTWPFNWAYRMGNELWIKSPGKPFATISKLYNAQKKIPTKHFICLNKKLKHERALLVDNLFKLDLSDKMYLSWLNQDIDPTYTAKHWDQRTVKLDSYTDNHHVFNIENFLLDYTTDSSFQVVTETIFDTVYWTEKTFRCIALGKPFLIWGAPTINMRLKSYGFELYDNLFDYKFDYHEDINQRAEDLALTVKNVCDNNTPEQIYKLTRTRAKRNRDRLIEIVKTQKYIPRELIKLKTRFKLTWKDLDTINPYTFDKW